MINPGLDGKVVLITGANHGIGAAAARLFAAHGSRVFIACYRSPGKYTAAELEEARKSGIGGPLLYEAMHQQAPGPIVEEIRTRGGQSACHEADLADAGNVPVLFARCEKVLGPVDILVNNHTHCILDAFDPALVTDEGFGIHPAVAEIIDAHFAINARAYVLMMAEYLKRYLERNARWGRIINLSTDAAHAHVMAVSYAASKHAIESYSRSAAAELGKYGITVNIVAPGPIQTGYIRPDQEIEIGLKTPLGRVGKPEDVADVIVFLASEQAHWLTGQLLYVGGGWRMHQ
jgi:3-oxoacyl-[acyl-carrier protein] reductase